MNIAANDSVAVCALQSSRQTGADIVLSAKDKAIAAGLPDNSPQHRSLLTTGGTHKLSACFTSRGANAKAVERVAAIFGGRIAAMREEALYTTKNWLTASALIAPALLMVGCTLPHRLDGPGSVSPNPRTVTAPVHSATGTSSPTEEREPVSRAESQSAVARASAPGSVKPAAQSASRAAASLAPPRPAQVVVRRRAQLPLGPLNAFYTEKYAEAEAGNADAMYQLGLVLMECSQFDATPHALKTSIESAQKTRQWAGSATDPEWTAAELRRRYARCEGINAKMRDRYYEVMAAAADRGSVEAMESMVFQLPPDDICREKELRSCNVHAQTETKNLRERQAAWLHQAQENGSANALWHLAAAYLNGEMESTDKQEAYVYLRAYQIVSEAFGQEVQASQLLRDLQRQLSRAEITQADARARSLVANPNCCIYLR
ncbi:hypothetical protein RM530_15985 [Algiphilus sp. W345]|uniref:Sel1 repeat family protein n=1 Tax=Banduia mediterranea TaxID=3075609 RepID=A0ABU2WNM9_9GAMM|nr:hypothetical protein [Algiphilus sp. W345]MDT0498849.1 hypothetical protein [Algiphilus sp. W345]